jgi:hemerythrin-like domain-containing protein
MLRDIVFLDDATRPPLVPLDGLTPEQKLPGRHLREIHDHLRQNMQVLGRLIEQAAAGTVTQAEVAAETADMTIIANYRRFGTLCGQHCQFVEMHHSIEDYAVFPELALKGEGFRRIAERLKAEHEVVHALLERLIDALDALAGDPTTANFEAARELYDALARVLLSHLGYEEESIGDALGYFRIGD